MATRPYVSPLRAEAAAKKRERVIEAAGRYLREEAAIATFSLDAIAKAAGVTRLTVYNQFGSRRGLLEAVFDEIARRGRLFRIKEAMTESDPRKGLALLVEIFCAFWASDPAIARLHDAMAIDQEFGQALRERNERRQPAIARLVDRIAGSAAPEARRDATDLIFALTSCAMFRMLANTRSEDAVCPIITDAVQAAVDRILPAASQTS